MKPNNYDLKTAKTIKALRVMRGLKQFHIADVLCIERSTYSKIENGERVISPSQLKTISDIFKISMLQLFALVEGNDSIGFEDLELSELKVWFECWNNLNAAVVEFTDSEIQKFLTAIKERKGILLLN